MKIAILLLLLSIQGFGDLAAGLQALRNGDYASALKEFVPLANQGNTDAQLRLALMYKRGLGVPQDYKEVVRWLRAAGNGGEANAQFMLGVMYSDGTGVQQDYKEAI